MDEYEGMTATAKVLAKEPNRDRKRSRSWKPAGNTICDSLQTGGFKKTLAPAVQCLTYFSIVIIREIRSIYIARSNPTITRMPESMSHVTYDGGRGICIGDSHLWPRVWLPDVDKKQGHSSIKNNMKLSLDTGRL